MRILLFIALFLATYATANADRVITCERRTMSLSCLHGNVIKVTSANYGMTDPNQCGGSIRTTNCGRDVRTTVRSICQDQQSCQVEAKNNLFGDSCQGTRKYLRVEYRCERPTVAIVTACERSELTLTCPVNTRIYIDTAMYGRQGSYTCHKNKLRTLRCASTNSKTVVERRCKNRRTCTVPAQNSVFGDPCRGTHKYLQVRYGCRS